MSRVVSCSQSVLLLCRRAYTKVAAAGTMKAKGQGATASKMSKVVDPNINLNEVVKGVEKEIFWMKDPKTGNWIPETHFNEVDAVELRAKFLSKKL